MYSRLKSWTFPRKGVRPTTRRLAGGLYVQRSTGANCAVRSGLRPTGVFSAGVLAHGEARSRPAGRDGLAHTAVGLGRLKRGRFTRQRNRLGETAAASPRVGPSPGRSVRVSRPTKAAPTLNPEGRPFAGTVCAGSHYGDPDTAAHVAPVEELEPRFYGDNHPQSEN